MARATGRDRSTISREMRRMFMVK
ncbi:hypothetical protein [Bifidobacterium catenulatum]